MGEGGGRFGALSNSQLPAHATRARGRRDVGGDSHGLEFAVAICHSPAECHALGARADGVGSVLDVGPRDEDAELGEQDRADAEVAVGAVRGGLGSDGVPFEVV